MTQNPEEQLNLSYRHMETSSLIPYESAALAFYHYSCVGLLMIVDWSTKVIKNDKEKSGYCRARQSYEI